jgi:hypothetical protein
MVDIAIHVHHLGFALLQVTLGIKDDPAGDRAIGAGVAGFQRALQLEVANSVDLGCFRLAKSEGAKCGGQKATSGALQEIAA